MTHMDQYIIPAGNAPRPRPASSGSTSRRSTASRTARSTRAREKVYPKLAHGRFRTVKWLVMAATPRHLLRAAVDALGSRPGPARPGGAARHGAQPLLLLLPRDLAAGVLLRHRPAGAGGAWRCFSSRRAAGRVWCGYTCPQTVWTDLMIAGRALLAGRPQRPHAPRQGALGAGRSCSKKAHDAHLLARNRLGDRRRLRLLFPRRADACRRAARRRRARHRLLFLGIFPLTTYRARRHRPRAGLHLHVPLAAHPGRHGRPRDAAGQLQAAIAASRAGPTRRAQPWEGRGDCIDCKACVAVCPTGIDIRDGSQLECIQCALCIDACDDIMDKVGRPRGLIGYDTIAKQEAAAKGTRAPLRLVRAAHAALRRPHLRSSAPSCWRRCSTARRSRSTCCTTATRRSCCCRTAASATATRSRSSTSCTSRANSLSRCAACPARSSPSSACEPGAKIRVTTDDLREVRVFVTVPRAELARLADAVTPFALVVRDAASGTTPPAPRASRRPRPSRGGAHEPDEHDRATAAGPAGAARAGRLHRLLRHVFLVNGAMIYEAISTHTGLVANEPYRKGLAYNDAHRRGRAPGAPGLDRDAAGRPRRACGACAGASGTARRARHAGRGRAGPARYQPLGPEARSRETAPGRYEAQTGGSPRAAG